MKDACRYCGAKVKSERALYCNSCYRAKSAAGCFKRKSSTSRDTTLKAAKVRKCAAKQSEVALQSGCTLRAQNGRYTISEGLQMKAYAKVTSKAWIKQVIAVRPMQPNQTFRTSSIAVYSNKNEQQWDVWALQGKSTVGCEKESDLSTPHAERRIYVTSRQRPPSSRTNEMIFMIQRTECMREANVLIRVKQDTTQYSVELEVIRSIKSSEKLVAHYERS